MPIFTPLERLGTLLSARYRIERILAVGGMGVVFAGRDAITARPVAVKVLKAHDLLVPTRGVRFLQEARLLVGLRHPHVVEILDFGEDEYGAPYLVMELLEGESLEALLARSGTLPPESALELLLPVLGALALVHDAGVVHRDVKPDNIFLALGAHGEIIPKLLDFGIAKASDSVIDTREGAVVGTPEYMAPEQLAGRVPTPATDVWAAAALFYRCAAGKAPYGGAHSAEVLARLSHEAPPRLDAPGLPAGFRAAIERGLSREASRRYPNTREFAAALVLTAREGGVRVPQALVASAGLEGFDWDRTSLGARTVSSASLSRPRPIGRWAPAALVLSSLALGWAAVRHTGEHVTAARSETVRPAEAIAPDSPLASVASGTDRSEASTPLPERAPTAAATGEDSSRPVAPARPSERRRPPLAHARPVRSAPPSPAPTGAEAHRERDDLPVVTEW